MLIREATAQQDIIGWYNFCKGRLVKRWRVAQDHYLNNSANAKWRSSKTWSRHLILQIYSVVYSQWEHRNSVVTKATKERPSITERNKMENEIRKQFDIGCGTLRPKDHRMLECTMDSILKMNLKAQKY